MGNMQSMALAEAVADGTASLQQALAIQVQSNFWPPLPSEYVALGMSALADPTGIVQIPDGISMVPNAATQDPETGDWSVEASILIDILHLEPFMADEEECLQCKHPAHTQPCEEWDADIPGLPDAHPCQCTFRLTFEEE